MKLPQIPWKQSITMALEARMMADSTNQTLPINPPGWLTNCLSMTETHPGVWASDWLNSLQKGLNKADLTTTEWGYQQLSKRLESLLQQQYFTEGESYNVSASILLRQLLVMHVYLQMTTGSYFPQLVKTPAIQWKEQIANGISILPHEIFINQLSLLGKELHQQQPINILVENALFKMHLCALKVYFNQLLEWFRTTSNHCLLQDEENKVLKPYIQMTCLLHTYTNTKTNILPAIKKECLPNKLLEQLVQIIEVSCTLDLSPSWLERLKEWIELFFTNLQSFYTTPNAKNYSKTLRTISQQLLRAAKESVQNKQLQSPELIRQRCWLYFWLHEELVNKWEILGKKKYFKEYQSTALSLFESFISTFESPINVKDVMRANPLKGHRRSWFKRKEELKIEELPPLLTIALNKLSVDFFIQDWSSYSIPYHSSFLHWLLPQYKARFTEKIKAYAMDEKVEFQKPEISKFDKIKLSLITQAIHNEFCNDLNKITQVILRIWLKNININLAYAKLADVLSRPGWWLHQKNQAIPKQLTSMSDFAVQISRAVGCFGTGIYFFPLFQQQWSAFQDALTANKESNSEFIFKHHAEMKVILNKLLFIFHPDHKSEAARNNIRINALAKHYIKQIQSVKCNLQKFKERNPSELQCLNAEMAANVLLNGLSNLVRDSMYHQFKSVEGNVIALSLTPEELQKYSPKKQLELNILREDFNKKELERNQIKNYSAQNEGLLVEKKNERKEKEGALERGEKERKEKEEALVRGEKERKEKEEALVRGDKERKEKEEALIRGDKERKEKEEALEKIEIQQKENEKLLAEIAHLKASSARGEGHAQQPVTVTEVHNSLYHVPASQESANTTANPPETKYNHGS